MKNGGAVMGQDLLDLGIDVITQVIVTVKTPNRCRPG